MTNGPADAATLRAWRRAGLRSAGPWMVGLAGAGLLIALYLSYVKLAGENPACGPLIGCATVSNSPYAEFIGVPVALFGALGSALILAAAAGWWLRGWQPGLVLAYLLGLASLPVVAYLTYLELFVIHAVCAWCVAYAATIVAGWLVAAVALWRQGSDTAGTES